MSSVAETRGGSGRAAALGRAVEIVADGLSLAAAPTFGVMALLTAALGGGQPDILCATGHASALGGMVTMYGLMSALHLAPWLRLISPGRYQPQAVTYTVHGHAWDHLDPALPKFDKMPPM